MGFQYGFASATGTSHMHTGTPCQDACAVKTLHINGQDILIAAVCDGAGSAPNAAEGSAIISSEFCRLAEMHILEHGGMQDMNKEAIMGFISEALLTLILEASAADRNRTDYACTLLAAIVSPGNNFFVQVGDGAIVVSDPDTAGEYLWVFWPQKGRYANTTNFITDEDYPFSLEFAHTHETISDIAIFSDGLESIALKYDTKEAFSPFFRPLFTALRNQKSPEDFNRQIEGFLQSEKVNERTDDDKTIVLASFTEDKKEEISGEDTGEQEQPDSDTF